MSDIVVFDNRDGSFSAVEPTWPRSEIRLIQVLSRLMQEGVHIVLATRSGHSDKFLSNLKLKSDELETLDQLTVYKDEKKLHIKGILTDSVYVSGSMNLTYNGIEVLKEGLTVDCDERAIAQGQLAYSKDLPAKATEVDRA